MKAGNFILNNDFLRNSPKGIDNLQELIILYELKSVIIDDSDWYIDPKNLHEDLHIIEEAIQEAFGFPSDRDYHRFWEWPYCKCPHLDNIDNRGTELHYFSDSCPVHGEL